MAETSPTRYRYREGILAQLSVHGIQPRGTTPPDLVYEHLKSLYCFRIRELKLLRRELERELGPQPLDTYRRQLEDLRREYPALVVPPHHWVERGTDAILDDGGETTSGGETGFEDSS